MRFLLSALLLGFLAWNTRAQNDPNSDTFLCRLRVVNVSKSIQKEVEQQFFDIRFQFKAGDDQGPRRTFWLGSIPTDDNRGIEVIYKVFIPEGAEIVGVSYPANPSLDSLSPKEFTIRCSNANYTNTTQGVNIIFTQSYIANLESPSQNKGRSTRKIVLQKQKYVDCYAQTGYEHPYTLDEIHRYLGHSENFFKGCSGSFTCTNGAYGGVSRCPPFRIPPKSEFIRVLNAGQCCDGAVNKTEIELRGCPKDEHGSYFEGPETDQYVPWQVRFVKWDGSECDGVILEKQWFLTVESCLKDEKFQLRTDVQFLRPLGIKYQPTKFRNVTIIETKRIDEERSVALILAKINLPFVEHGWTTAIQKVNLPPTYDHCKQLLEKDCHLILGTEQQSPQNASTVVGTMTETSTYSVKHITKRSPDPVLIGSAAVSCYEKTNFLVGLYIGDREGDEIQSICYSMQDFDDVASG